VRQAIAGLSPLRVSVEQHFHLIRKHYPRLTQYDGSRDPRACGLRICHVTVLGDPPYKCYPSFFSAGHPAGHCSCACAPISAVGTAVQLRLRLEAIDRGLQRSAIGVTILPQRLVAVARRARACWESSPKVGLPVGRWLRNTACRPPDEHVSAGANKFDCSPLSRAARNGTATVYTQAAEIVTPEDGRAHLLRRLHPHHRRPRPLSCRLRRRSCRVVGPARCKQQAGRPPE